MGPTTREVFNHFRSDYGLRVALWATIESGTDPCRAGRLHRRASRIVSRAVMARLGA